MFNIMDFTPKDYNDLVDNLTYINYVTNRPVIEPEGYIRMGLPKKLVWRMEKRYQHEYAEELVNRRRN